MSDTNINICQVLNAVKGCIISEGGVTYINTELFAALLPMSRLNNATNVNAQNFDYAKFLEKQAEEKKVLEHYALLLDKMDGKEDKKIKLIAADSPVRLKARQERKDYADAVATKIALDYYRKYFNANIDVNSNPVCSSLTEEKSSYASVNTDKFWAVNIEASYKTDVLEADPKLKNAYERQLSEYQKQIQAIVQAENTNEPSFLTQAELEKILTKSPLFARAVSMDLISRMKARGQEKLPTSIFIGNVAASLAFNDLQLPQALTDKIAAYKQKISEVMRPHNLMDREELDIDELKKFISASEVFKIPELEKFLSDWEKRKAITLFYGTEGTDNFIERLASFLAFRDVYPNLKRKF